MMQKPERLAKGLVFTRADTLDMYSLAKPALELPGPYRHADLGLLLAKSCAVDTEAEIAIC